ncbi:MAG TPA: stage II sporulation protein M [Acidimicrobiales bacterium]|nr:stage II sporulation protein M [Acidimicrobiales bacterium]
MDLDRFVAANQATWDRLSALVARANRGIRHLDAAELDELVRLYQRASTHLSLARTYTRDPALVARLTGLVASAAAVVYGTRPRSLRTFGRFFATTFPAAVWHLRRFVAASALLLLLPALAVGLWLDASPRAVDAAAPPAVRQSFLEDDFEAYYSSRPASEFAAQVFTNNVRVAVLAFAGGILACLPTAFVLAVNGANVGVAGGLFAAAGQSPRFFGLILPHGLLELTAVAVAGGAGLALGWAWLVPGDRRRRDALAEEGRRSVAVVLGLVAAFAGAGLIEGFVTGRPWPTTLRVGIGVAAWVAFGLSVVIRGRRAAALGLTGLLDESDDTVPTRLSGHSRTAGVHP